MKKNDIFTFTAPNGVEVTGVVLSAAKSATADDSCVIGITEYICYAQNRIFTYIEKNYWYRDIDNKPTTDTVFIYEDVIVDYAILPDYDAMLDRYNDIKVAQAETAMGM